MPYKFFLLFVCFYGMIQSGFSQNFSIVGSLKDSSANTYETNAVISILKQEDSTLTKFARSNHLGKFKINDLQPGNYLLLITYPKYADFIEPFKLGTVPNLDFKEIYLSKKATILKEIIINQTAIRIKGDTTEYKADSFLVKPNATVEDLLKELPGIQVDKDGRIIAHGQTVSKILVDGQEFFGDDPTIASRNLRADAVDKVQVFDKKSDQSAFTGIDDGKSTKTINLELKDASKNGYFGKIGAAALNEYYNGQAFINSFKQSRKLAAFIITSTTEKTGLSFDESTNYGFDNNNIRIDEESGAMFITSNGGDDLGSQNYSGAGLPESIKGGLNYSNKWKGDATKTNGNYLFNKLKEHRMENSFRQNTLIDSVYFNRENVDHNSLNRRHTLSGIFETIIDSSSSLKLEANGYAGIFEKNDHFESEALAQNNQRTNNSIRKTNSTGDNLSLNASALYRKKFKKQGRTFSLNISTNYFESDQEGYLQNKSFFYDKTNILLKTDTTDQHKKNLSKQSVLRNKITYTEPLSAKSFLEINYSFSHNSSHSQTLSFNKDLNSKFSVLVDSLSNDFDYKINTHSAGINYRFNEKKYYYSFGGNISNTEFNQHDLEKNSSRKYDYINLFPQAVFNYKFNSFSNFNIKYSGKTNQPTINQLQPLKNNNDPLNIIIGNPDLRQEFKSTVQLTYSNFQVMNERYLILSSFLVHTSNMITSSYNIDSLGRRVYQPVNTDNGYAISFGSGYSIKIANTPLRLAFGPSLNYSEYNNFINGERNVTRITNILFRINAKMAKKEKYDLYATLIPSFNNSTSSISAASSTRFTNYNLNTGGSFTLPAKFEFGTDININLREKVNKYDINNNVVLLNAYIEKKLLKNDLLSLRLSINDILDQNKGYDRYINPFYMEEKTFLTFRRYGLICLTYNIMNKGGKVKKEDGTIRL
ncbi:MAG: outer membrane beta-barrel family protein [Ginsengibacter sp.]